MQQKYSWSRLSVDLIMWHKYLGGLSSGFTCISYGKSDFLIPCPELIRVCEISNCHVLHCPYIPTPISSRNLYAVRFVKPLLIFALRSTINNEFVPQLSWHKIRSISGVIVMVNYSVTSRRLQESNFLSESEWNAVRHFSTSLLVMVNV